MADGKIEVRDEERRQEALADLRTCLDMAREMEVPMPFVALAYQMFSIAQANGMDGFEATGIACNVYDVITGQKHGV